MPCRDPLLASLLRQREVLAKFGELALRSDSLDEVLMEACRLVSEALGTDLAKVMELQADGCTLLVRAGVGWKDGVVGTMTVKAESGSSEGFALRTGNPVISPDISKETRFEYADFVKDNGVRAIVSVIILGAENQPPFGIIQVDSRNPRPFDEDDTRFLQGYANLVAAAVNRIQVANNIRRSATYDPVTTLPNRVVFTAELASALRRAGQDNTPVSLLLVDLDRFKQVNDLLGHQVGDAALCAFAVRLVEALPRGVTVARLGGDEFVAILVGNDCAAAKECVGRLLDSLAFPFTVGGGAVDLRSSIGVSTFPADGRSPTQLIRSADLALYAAKKDGGNRARIFQPSMRAERHGQLAMLRHARTALKNDWIKPFYQPQVKLSTGAIDGFEALLRWHHPRAGLQFPSTIAYAFDEFNTASLLGSVIADAALIDLNHWTHQGWPIKKLAINVSAAEFRDPGYADKLLARLVRHEVAPALIEIEITETAFLDNGASGVTASLATLRDAGMSIALDDFGTGFSSLSHLRDLPVDTIKIDRSFISGLDKSPRDRSITEAILMLGTALGMTTIAEGVETHAQADFLRDFGCTYAQGFLFGDATDALEVEHLMERVSAKNQWLVQRVAQSADRRW